MKAPICRWLAYTTSWFWLGGFSSSSAKMSDGLGALRAQNQQESCRRDPHLDCGVLRLRLFPRFDVVPLFAILGAP